jgi:hypothetical protein
MLRLSPKFPFLLATFTFALSSRVYPYECGFDLRTVYLCTHFEFRINVLSGIIILSKGFHLSLPSVPAYILTLSPSE